MSRTVTHTSGSRSPRRALTIHHDRELRQGRVVRRAPSTAQVSESDAAHQGE
jgi:hypothetical protein